MQQREDQSAESFERQASDMILKDKQIMKRAENAK
jgi:hypothetical protein